jgi:SAM-dependent methyltransferase
MEIRFLRHVWDALSRKPRSLRRPRKREDEARLEAMVGPPGLWQSTREFQFRFLKEMGLQPRHSLLDIGCGPLRGGLPVIEYLEPDKYCGLDKRREAIEEAVRQVKAAGLVDKRPQLLQSDSFGGDELRERTFDYIWVFQVLYHLEDALAQQFFRVLRTYFHQHTIGLANVNTNLPESTWNGFPFVRRPLEFYLELAKEAGLEVAVLGKLKDFGYMEAARGKENHVLKFSLSQA